MPQCYCTCCGCQKLTVYVNRATIFGRYAPISTTLTPFPFTLTAAKIQDTFRDVKMSNTIWDCSNFIAANSKYVAVTWHGGGGKLAVINHENTVKLPSDTPCLLGVLCSRFCCMSFKPKVREMVVMKLSNGSSRGSMVCVRQ